MRRAAFALLFALAPNAALAGEPGTRGANFLHLGAGPRAIGMGEAQTAAAEGPYATYWNPAALSRLSYPEAAFMFNRLHEGMDQQFIAYAHPLEPGRALAGSLTRFSAGSIESYDANALRRGSVESSDMGAALAYGQLFELPGPRSPNLSVGIGGKWLREELGRASAQTFAGDFGLLVSNLDGWMGEAARGLYLGATARHIGPGLRFHSDSAPLPRTLSFGMALERRPWGDPVILALDVKSPADDSPSVAFGLECRARQVLALRLGYLTGQDEGLGLRVGFGLFLKRVEVDYALATFGGLGSMHRFGLNFRFGGAPDVREKTAEDFFEQGRRYLQQNRHYEALQKFNEALRLDPGSVEALDGIRQATSAMEQKSKRGGDGRR